MWYIIKTDYYKERDAIKDLLRLDSIEDIYFPNSRPKPTDIGWDKKKVSFRPVINGILFAYVKDVKLLLKDLNANGYFLRKKSRPTTSGPKWQAMHTSSR
uniref:transcription termination/antitermination NusG family protein n=1 Tax=Prevotella sp. TaxID=59823 RepID=UPI0040294F0A